MGFDAARNAWSGHYHDGQRGAQGDGPTSPEAGLEGTFELELIGQVAAETRPTSAAPPRH